MTVTPAEWTRNWPQLYDSANANRVAVIANIMDDACTVDDQMFDSAGAAASSAGNSGQEILTIPLLYTDPVAALVQNEMCIRANGSVFRVKQIEEGVSEQGSKYAVITGEALWYDLGDADAVRIDPPLTSPSGTISALIAGTGWTVGTVSVAITGTPQAFFPDPTTPLAALRSLPAIFGGELYFDCNAKTVNLVPQRGDASGNYLFAYKHNLGSIARTLDSTSLCTRLYPIGANSIDITTVNGGKGYIENYSYFDNLGWPRRVLAQEITNDTISDPAQLLSWGQSQLTKLSQPQASYAVQALMISGTDTPPGLGDVVRVHDDDLNIDFFTRVVSRHIDVIELANSTITVDTALYLITTAMNPHHRRTEVNAGTLHFIVNPHVGDNSVPNPKFEHHDSVGFPVGYSTYPDPSAIATITTVPLATTPVSGVMSGNRVLSVSLPASGSLGGVRTVALPVTPSEHWNVRADFAATGPTALARGAVLACEFSTDPTFVSLVSTVPPPPINAQVLSPDAVTVYTATPPTGVTTGIVGVVSGYAPSASATPFRMAGEVVVPSGATFMRVVTRAGSATASGATSGVPDKMYWDQVRAVPIGIGDTLISGLIETGPIPPNVVMAPSGIAAYSGTSWAGLLNAFAYGGAAALALQPTTVQGFSPAYLPAFLSTNNVLQTIVLPYTIKPTLTLQAPQAKSNSPLVNIILYGGDVASSSQSTSIVFNVGGSYLTLDSTGKLVLTADAFDTAYIGTETLYLDSNSKQPNVNGSSTALAYGLCFAGNLQGIRSNQTTSDWTKSGLDLVTNQNARWTVSSDGRLVSRGNTLDLTFTNTNYASPTGIGLADKIYLYGQTYGIGLTGSTNGVAIYTASFSVVSALNAATGVPYSGGGNGWAPVHAAAFTVESSRVGKKRVRKLKDGEDGLNKVLALRPVRYEPNSMRDRHKERTKVGLIAEEVLEVLPEAVGWRITRTPDPDGRNPITENDWQVFGLDYSALVPILVKAVQELTVRVDNLTKVTKGS